ncbi:MAG: ABC transporter ATP-binding protein [Candidatus Kariarchaeaceae archaeon]|jgi:putative ABC transport system ATP-binding protein
MVWLFSRKKDKLPPLKVPTDIAVSVDKIHKIYKQDERDVTALEGISFSVKKGEFFSIVGRSGSGKTTLLNLLGAMERPSSGRIAINGKTLRLLGDRELTEIRRNEIATIYQSYNLIPVLSAFQNVELPMLLVGIEKKQRRERAMKLLDIVGLMDRMQHKPDELSGGEQQRVSIARALANKPSLIFADEPTGDLDMEIAQEIINLLEGINRDLGTTLVLVTHDLKFANRADRIMKLKEGYIDEILPGKGKKIREKELKTRIVRDPSYY